MPSAHASDPPVARFANIFVIVALAAMLAGAVGIISARETAVVDLEPGQQATLLDHSVPEWERFGRQITVFVKSAGNFTVGDTPEGVDDEVVIRIGRADGEVVRDDSDEALTVGSAIWSERATSGERWTIVVENHGDERPARVSTTVSSPLAYTIGGVLVGIGVLGFVSYRVGMRSSHS